MESTIIVVMVREEIPTAEVMAMLDVNDPSLISRWVRDGKLTPSRRIGAGRNAPMLFWRADIERLADELRQDLAERIARIDHVVLADGSQLRDSGGTANQDGGGGGGRGGRGGRGGGGAGPQ